MRDKSPHMNTEAESAWDYYCDPGGSADLVRPVGADFAAGYEAARKRSLGLIGTLREAEEVIDRYVSYQPGEGRWGRLMQMIEEDLRQEDESNAE